MYIKTDGGRSYVLEKIQIFCDRFQIKHKITSLYQPESNGLAERFIQTIKGMLENVKLNEITNWRKALQIVVAACWMVPHWGTGFLPFMMLYSQEAILPQEIQYVKGKEIIDYKQAVKEHMKEMIKIHKLAISRNKEYLRKMKIYFNNKKVNKKKMNTFGIGNQVWFNMKHQIADKKKYTSQWIVLCEVMATPIGGLYTLKMKTKDSAMIFNWIHPQFLNHYKEKH